MDMDKAAANRYRERAEEVRVIAEKMTDLPSKRTLMGVARDYDCMAHQLENAAAIDRSLANTLKTSNSY
jgi:hypothetical protein